MSKLGLSEVTPEQIAERTEEIWINALTAINPPDKLLRDIGELVLRNLRESDVELDALGVRHGSVIWLRVVAS